MTIVFGDAQNGKNQFVEFLIDKELGYKNDFKSPCL